MYAVCGRIFDDPIFHFSLYILNDTCRLNDISRIPEGEREDIVNEHLQIPGERGGCLEVIVDESYSLLAKRRESKPTVRDRRASCGLPEASLTGCKRGNLKPKDICPASSRMEG